MASYPAPTETLPIFSPGVFNVNDVPLTITEGAKYFITYPAAQGAITIGTLSNGTATISTANITTAVVSGTLTTNVVSPSYTTLTLVAGNIGYSYTPTITIALIAGDIGTQNVSVGVWLITFNIFLAGSTASYLSIRDATGGGGTELARSYVATNSYKGTAVLAVLTGTKDITIRQTGVSATAGTGSQRWSITRIA